MAIAIPIGIAAEELALWLLAALGIAATGAAVQEASRTQTRTDADTCRDCPCPPCTPPVGTVAYEIHMCPPHDVHWPCPKHHIHWFKRMQNPKNCMCFWKRNFQPHTCFADGQVPPIPPGAVPVTP